MLDRRGLEQEDCSDEWEGDASVSGLCCLPGAYWSDPTDQAACYGSDGGGEGDQGADAPPPLECASLKPVIDPGGYHNIINGATNQVQQAFVDPIRLLFQASGGSGSYSFSVTQFYQDNRCAMTANGGGCASLPTRLDKLLPGESQQNGSILTFEDNPGLGTTLNGNPVQAFVFLNYYTTFVTITDSNGDSVKCNPVFWDAFGELAPGGKASGTASIIGGAPQP